MARLGTNFIHRLSDLGNTLAEVVAPIDEDEEDDENYADECVDASHDILEHTTRSHFQEEENESVQSNETSIQRSDTKNPSLGNAPPEEGIVAARAQTVDSINSSVRLQEAEARSQEFERKLSMMAEERANLLTSLVSKGNECKQLKQIIDQLRKNKTVRAQESDAAIRERDDLKMSSKAQAEQISDLNRQLDLMRAELQGQGEIKEIERSKNSRIQQLEEAHKKLRTEFEALTQNHQLAQQAVHEASIKVGVYEADLEVSRVDLERSSLALANLRKVLEDFESDKAEGDKVTDARWKSEIDARDGAFKAQLEHFAKSNEALLAQKDTEIRALVLDNELIRNQLKQASEDKDMEVRTMRRSLDMAIEQLQTRTKDVVDRRLMSNLIVQYHEKRKSLEVLELVARILGFTDEEKRKVGLQTRQGFLGKMLTPLPAPDISPEEVESSNLVELWVSFLEKETGCSGE